MTEKVGLGGSCHWCMEAIFQSLKGVEGVEQVWICPAGNEGEYAEGVMVIFHPEMISLSVLIDIHLSTHSCTSDHAMRDKYRSAVYVFSEKQEIKAATSMVELQKAYEEKVVTKVLRFGDFKKNSEQYLNYYYKNPDKPFCKSFIDPKLQLLLAKFRLHTDPEKLNRS